MQEQNCLASLNNASVVKPIDFFLEPQLNRIYFVQELAPGK
jgi:hypothetical protein